MKTQRLLPNYVLFIFIGLLFAAPIVSPYDFTVNAQGIGGGNSVSGHVFGLDRQPLSDVNVDLLNDYGQIVQRTRTNSSGYYSFRGVASGRFQVRVLPYGTPYEEQVQDGEIVNFTRNVNGTPVTSGFSNEQRDFNLRVRKGAQVITGAVFAQEIPPQAQKLYEKAVEDLDDKREKEGLEGLKSALEIFPKYYNALERLGTEYVRLKHYNAAQILLNLAVEVNPRGFKSWYGLAYALYSLGRLNESMNAVDKAIEINSYSPEALILSGVLLRQAKKFKESEKQLLKAKEQSIGIVTSTANWQLYLLYANDLKRYKDAAKELKLYLKNNPEAKNAEEIKTRIKELETKAQNS